MHDQRSTPRRVRFGVFELDFRAGELRKGQSRLKVPDKSIEILKALVEQPGELVTREALRDRLWPANTFVDFEHGLNAAVRRLRDALGDSAEAPRFIETLPRRGYRFIGTIDEPPQDNGSADQPGRVAETVPAEAVTHPTAPRASRRERLAWLLSGVLAISLLTTVLVTQRPRADAAIEPTQLTIAPPKDAEFGPMPAFAVSPDGRQLVFVARSKNESYLWLKSRSSTAITRLPGTEGAGYPFWSPDNQYVGFFSSGRLKKYRMGRTTSEAICDAPFGRGGTWNARDEIVFAPSTDADLMKVSASGGPVVAVTVRDARRGDTTHRLPQFLPDGRHFLFWAGAAHRPPRSRLVRSTRQRAPPHLALGPPAR